MRKEVIANKETQENKIIYYSFKVYLKWRVGDLQIILQIFSQHPYVKKLSSQWIKSAQYKPNKKQGQAELYLYHLNGES